MQENQAYIWQETREGGIRLLRVFGNDPVVRIPDQINGKTVTEIGEYCFSREARWKKKEYDCSSGKIEEDLELAGKEIEQILLPETVEKIGHCAFYNCTELKQITMGKQTAEFDSDAFLNCKNLHRVCLRSSVKEKSGIRQMLAQLTWDVLVQFMPDQLEAVLFYPEYREYYDEIGPAHIFCMNIEGEGFRLRKAFQDERVELSLYDAAFEKASAEESAQALQTIALNRLRYPVELSEQVRIQYETYLQKQQKSLFLHLLKEQDLDAIRFLVKESWCDEKIVTELITEAAAQGWTEGAAQLLQLRQEQPKKNRYSFDF
ncbi:MAG: leucine-rich repeat domain-containing protein [Lachnospiraceae bacterium]